MKAIELRIGNWVQDSRDNYPCKVLGVDSERTFASGNGDILMGTATCTQLDELDGSRGRWLQYLDPIPITEELMFKCGFQKRSESRCTMILSLGNGDPLTDKLCPSLQWWIGNDYMSICRCGISALSFKIQNLHQLQNLFYDLTGEELNINL